jgi:hypothetical protein
LGSCCSYFRFLCSVFQDYVSYKLPCRSSSDPHTTIQRKNHIRHRIRKLSGGLICSHNQRRWLRRIYDKGKIHSVIHDRNIPCPSTNSRYNSDPHTTIQRKNHIRHRIRKLSGVCVSPCLFVFLIMVL